LITLFTPQFRAVFYRILLMVDLASSRNASVDLIAIFMFFINLIISFSFCQEFFGKGTATFEYPPHSFNRILGKWCDFSMFVHNTVSSQKVRAILEKIPLNPPLQKGEAVGMPGLIEMLREMAVS